MTILLVLIYLAFIGLGLPDSLLGAAWPQLRIDIGAPLSGAGMVSMIVTAGTIVSSLVSARVIRRFGTGKVTAVSTALTAAALLGYAFAPAYWWLCIMAIPLGLGAGAVDAALNNFVALHYKAHHMSWLHCFWGTWRNCRAYSALGVFGPSARVAHGHSQHWSVAACARGGADRLSAAVAKGYRKK